MLTSVFQDVKRVADDFPGERFSFLSVNQLVSVAKYTLRLEHISSRLFPLVRSVQSSAYDIKVMSGGGIGILLRYKLKSVGERTPP